MTPNFLITPLAVLGLIAALFFGVEDNREMLSLWERWQPQQGPENFDQAKILLRERVYHDQNRNGVLGTAYCGCEWRWVGRSAGRVDHASCGYEVRAQELRAERIEWEHVVPAHTMGHHLQCWQEQGRSNCRGDPVFDMMEADMHNLTPSVGEINADRSNYRFAMIPDTEPMHGQCDFRVDFRNRMVEPRDEVKGLFARIYFYVHDRYGLRMSPSKERVLMVWDHRFPVTEWERVRDQRIARVMGHSNPFVIGERIWVEGYEPTMEGLFEKIPETHPALPSQ